MEYLRIYKKGKFENLSFKKGIMLENEACLLIFTMQKTLLMKAKNGRKVWSFNNTDLDRVENYSDGVRIGLKKKMKKTDVTYNNIYFFSFFFSFSFFFLFFFFLF